MANAADIREQLGALLSQRISLDDFEQWFAPNSWNIHKSGDPDAQRSAYAIEHQLSRYKDDCDALRIELTSLLGASTDASPSRQQVS
jgi:hypothetical protein